jgi:hypothetical protein
MVSVLESKKDRSGMTKDTENHSLKRFSESSTKIIGHAQQKLLSDLEAVQNEIDDKDEAHNATALEALMEYKKDIEKAGKRYEKTLNYLNSSYEFGRLYPLEQSLRSCASVGMACVVLLALFGTCKTIEAILCFFD